MGLQLDPRFAMEKGGKKPVTRIVAGEPRPMIWPKVSLMGPEAEQMLCVWQPEMTPMKMGET